MGNMSFITKLNIVIISKSLCNKRNNTLHNQLDYFHITVQCFMDVL